MKKCLLDMDGIVADWVGGVCKHFNTPNPYEQEENFGRYGLEELIGVPVSDFWGIQNEEFWANLEPTKDWREILLLVENKFGRENVCLLTAPVLTNGCLEGKRKWVRKYLPEYERRLLIGPAKEFCASPTSVLIDDCEKNTKKFYQAGGKPFLFPRPWNQMHYLSKVALNHLQFFLETV